MRKNAGFKVLWVGQTKLIVCLKALRCTFVLLLALVSPSLNNDFFKLPFDLPSLLNELNLFAFVMESEKNEHPHFYIIYPCKVSYAHNQNTLVVL